MKELIRLLADGLIIPIVLAAGYALPAQKSRASDASKAYSLTVVVGLTGYLLAKLIASVWQPDTARPFELMNQTAGAFYLPNAGFPSDHALFCAFLTLSVLFVARQQKLALAMALMTLLVCVGRVLALVHTPLDVIGGVLIACVGALWYLQADRVYAKNILRSIRKNVVQ